MNHPIVDDVRVGDIVLYSLTTYDAACINKRRADASRNAAAIERGELGCIVHVGNPVSSGEEYPMVVTRVWTPRCVNGKVLLDGSDSYWVASAEEGALRRRWRKQ